MDFYVLLILPHLLALVGLAVFAYRSSPAEPGDVDHGGWGEGPGDAPPSGPEPGSPVSPPALLGGSSPWRRLRVGERLSELHPRRSRREHDPKPPVRPRAGDPS